MTGGLGYGHEPSQRSQAVVCSSAVKSRSCVSVSNAVHVDFLNSLIKGSHRYTHRVTAVPAAQRGDTAGGTCCGDSKGSDTGSLQLLPVLGDGSFPVPGSWHGIPENLPTTLKPLCKTRAGESQGAEEASQGSSPNPAGPRGGPRAGTGRVAGLCAKGTCSLLQQTEH